MKKFLWFLGAVIALGIVGQILTVTAAPYPPALGGTGTSIVPASGTIPIGNGAGTYTPSLLTPGTNVSITNASGSVTINASYSGITISPVGSATTTFSIIGDGTFFKVTNPSGSQIEVQPATTSIAIWANNGLYLIASNNLSDLTNTSTARTNLGLGTAALQNAPYFLVAGNNLSDLTSTSSARSNVGYSGVANQITISGAGAIGFSTTSISQFVNDVGYQTQNQTITFTASGDATGTATGRTSLLPSLTITGLQGKALPSLATGTLKYTGGAWTFDGNTYLVSGINVTTTAPLGGGGALTSAGLTLTCASCLTGNQTITLSGAVTGSGATSIATTYTTSTLFGFFSASNPIVYNSSTGQFTWSNTPGYISSVSVNGNSGTSFNIVAGSGITTSVSGTTTTITLNIGAGCSGSNFVQTISPTGTVSCAIPPAPSTTIPTIYVQSFGNLTGAVAVNASSGISLSTSSNIFSIANTGVTSFTGAGCATAANSTGTVALSVTCISGNQTITFKISGDATGTASGATSITDSITVTGLNGVALPANTTGTLQFSGSAWKINLATSSLGVYDSNGNLSSYLGSSCGGGQFVTGFSASGTVACGTPSSSGLTGNSTTTYIPVYINSSTFAGYAQLIYTSSSQTLNVPNLNNIEYADQYPGSDIGAQINNAIASSSSATPEIRVTASSSFSTTINIGSGKLPLIVCDAGVVLTYTGSGTSTIINTTLGANALWGIEGCDVPGTNNTGTGLSIGGSAGANNLTIYGTKWTTFNLGVTAGANVNWLYFDSNVVNFNNRNWLWTGGANSGEGIEMTGDLFADNSVITSSSLAKSVYWQGSVGDVEENAVHLDDAGQYVDTGGIESMTMTGNYCENPEASASSGYPGYTCLTLAPGSSGMYNIYGGEIKNDAQGATSTPAYPIVAGDSLNVDGLIFDRNGAAKWAGGIDDSSNNANVVIKSILPQNTPFSGNFMIGPGGTFTPNYPLLVSNDNGNQIEAWDTNASSPAFFDNNNSGSLLLGSNITGSNTQVNTSTYAWRLLFSQSSDSFQIQRSPATTTWNPTTFFSLSNTGLPTFSELGSSGNPCVTAGSGGALATSTCGSGTVSTSSALVSGDITLNTGGSTIGNSSLSQSAGTTFINGTTPVLDGGGDYIGPNIFTGPTSTAAVGNLNQSGGVTSITTSTAFTGAQFLGGGFFDVISTATGTATTTITLPTTSTISTAAAAAGIKIWASSFSQQFLLNSSTINVVSNTSGTNEIQLYSPGTPSVLAPGQEWFITGQFENSSTVLGATSTGMNLVIKYTLYQTSTPLTVNGNTITLTGTTVASGAQYYAAFASSTANASQTTINWNNSNVQELKLAVATTTITFTNTNAGARYILMLLQDASGSRIVTWPSTVQWAAGTAPTLTTTANKMDITTFVCAAVSGTDCYAGLNLNYTP